MEHRNCDRRQSRVALEVRGQGRKFLAQLFDLSPIGCSFDCSGSHLHRGDSVTFKLTETTRVSGTIVWRSGALAGVRFAAPLPDAIGVHARGPAGAGRAR